MSHNTKIKELPIDCRPYEKCLKYGVSALTEEELVAILLRSGTKGSSSLEVARKILHFSSGKEGLLNLHTLTLNELKGICGIGDVKAIQLKCIGEISKRIAGTIAEKGISFNRPETIADYYMEQLRHEDQELLLCMMLDTKNHRLGEEIIFKGTVNASYASPREIFLAALSYRAAGILLVHNHPSGDPTPSSADLTITTRIQNAGAMLGIPLIDHIIIGNCCYTSFRERDLL